MFNLLWFLAFFVGCVVWGEKVLRNGCSCYNNSSDNSLNIRKKRKSSIHSSIKTINNSLKKKVLFFINVSFWRVILTCVSKNGCLLQPYFWAHDQGKGL
jgi:hypothetical protein